MPAQTRKIRYSRYREQLKAVAAATDWERAELGRMISAQGYGSRHDKLDAFMAAWVASLPRERLLACGQAPNDVIWVPQ